MTHVDLIEKLLRYECSLDGGLFTTDSAWYIDTTHRNGTGPNKKWTQISARQADCLCLGKLRLSVDFKVPSQISTDCPKDNIGD